MGAGVVTVGRRPYAVGLYWENSPSGRVAQTAKEAAQQPGQQADYYAVRSGNKDGRVPQFGLSQASAGHKTGMPVLAPCLANQQPGSWAGAFRLKEGTVIIIVRDDLIVPDGDQFFLNESDARDRLLQEIGFGGLQRIYAPESWAVPGADTMPLSLLLNDRRDIRLQIVAIPKKTIMMGAAALGVVLVLLAGGWYYQEVQAEKEREKMAEESALEAMRARARQMVPDALQEQKPDYPPPERKWEKRAVMADILNACQGALSQIVSSTSGWRLENLKCDGLTVNMNWRRTSGITRVLEFPPPATVTTDDLGASATVSIPLASLDPRGPENLVDPDVVLAHYMAIDWQGNITTAPDDPPPPPPPGYNGPWSPPPPPWIKRSFTVTVQNLPGSLPEMFSQIPGVVVESLAYSPGTIGGNWQITGVVYENRI